jgi:hypothetical protein
MSFTAEIWAEEMKKHFHGKKGVMVSWEGEEGWERSGGKDSMEYQDDLKGKDR